MGISWNHANSRNTSIYNYFLIMNIAEISNSPMKVPELLPVTPSNYTVQNRGLRNSLLAQTDWTQVPDGPLSAQDKSSYAEYRKQLRDMSDFQDPIWPLPPGQSD